MKKYLSRVLCLLLCLALVFALCACDSGKTSSFTLDDDDSWELDDDADVTSDDVGGDTVDSDTSSGGAKRRFALFKRTCCKNAGFTPRHDRHGLLVEPCDRRYGRR